MNAQHNSYYQINIYYFGDKLTSLTINGNKIARELYVRGDRVQIRKMKICTDCGKVHGTWKNRGLFKSTYVQRCGCVHGKYNADNSEKWPDFDFDEIVTLCYCCGSELLPSGSRWSVWFCEECKKNILAMNHKVRAWLIPIGRHSMMHGIGINFHGIENEEEEENAIKEFIKRTKSLSKRQKRLYTWAASIVKENIKRLNIIHNGSDIRLSQYLNLIKRTYGDKEDCFRKMCEWFGINFY